MQKSIGCLLILLLFMLTNKLSLQCLEYERRALLSFIHDLADVSDTLSSDWVGKDCCKWQGIGCGNGTGHVVKLELNSHGSLGGPFPPSLYQLRTLEILDLSFNSLQGTIPASIGGAFPNLKELDLSGNKLHGSIPTTLGEISTLEVLRLGRNELSGLIPTSLNKLSNLIELDLNSNKLNGVIPDSLGQLSELMILDLSKNSLNCVITEGHFTKLHKLQLLSLGTNSLSLKIRHDWVPPFQLTEIDLGSCLVGPQFPKWLQTQKRLHTLTMSNASISDSISRSLENISSRISQVDLSGNSLHGSIPTSIGVAFPNLEALTLSGNKLHGTIPTTLGNMSTLKVLALDENELSGHIPASLGKLSNLIELNLRLNKLDGVVPESLGQLSEMIYLDLSNNSFNGIITEVHLGKLHNLLSLNLGWNSLSLKIRQGWIPPFQLIFLYLGYCEVGPQFPVWLQTQTRLNSLIMSNAGISESIPSWFENVSSEIYFINLAFNNIHGKVPNLGISSTEPLQIYLHSNSFEGPLPQFPQNLSVLDLSDNKINGHIPENIGDLSRELVYLGLSGNRLNGSIPSSLCKMHSLDYIDFSKNHLSGGIPYCLSDLQRLKVIDLAYNNLSGRIPSSIGQLPLLRSLHLSNNNFHEELPLALRRCKSLAILDLGNNLLLGSIPTWIGESLINLRILRLRSNNYTGGIPRTLCYLSSLQILDVTGNNLFGTIPQCFRNFSAMVFKNTTGLRGFATDFVYTDMVPQVIKGRELEYFEILSLVVNMDLSDNNFVGHIPQELTALSGLISLNLSRNHLTGNIPKGIGQMKSLESLDFSINHLSGRIPQSLSLLSSLSHLNLSYNNLSGPIPTGKQLQTLEDPSIYRGNYYLCGPEVQRKCLPDEAQQFQEYLEENGNSGGDGLINKWFYIGIASGFVVGFWGVCGFIFLNKSWRVAYFQFVDRISDIFV